MSERELRNDRYRRGVCIDCGDNPHSAGRTRCDDCHRTYSRGSFEPQLIRPTTTPQDKERKRWR